MEGVDYEVPKDYSAKSQKNLDQKYIAKITLQFKFKLKWK